MLPAGNLRVSAYHGQASLCSRATQWGCAEGQSPFAEGLGVSPDSNSLESLFRKEGRAAKTVQRNAAGVRGVPEISSLSPKSGGQGVEREGMVSLQ
jgi:hypothetical protein